jgi:hypothetical protein
MKPQDSKNLRAKKGVGRLWLGVAALVGAVGAYLGDPERGGARREAAVRQVSDAAKAATERARRWRNVVSARLSRPAEEKLPDQVTIPTDPGSAAPAKPPSAKRPSSSVPQAAEASAETKKSGS